MRERKGNSCIFLLLNSSLSSDSKRLTSSTDKRQYFQCKENRCENDENTIGILYFI